MTQNCPVCYSNQSLTLPCSDEFCEECIFDWIAEKNFNTLYTSLIFLPCLNHKCKTQISIDWLYQNLSNKYLKSLNEIFIRKHINTDMDIQKCPSCNYAGFVDRSYSCSDYLYCAICKEKWFDSTLSRIGFIYRSISYMRNIKENLLSDMSELNVLLTSKPCQNCKIKIYKSGGCDHVICTNCNTDTCYNCMRSHNGGVVICGFKYFLLSQLFGFIVLGILLKIVFSFTMIYNCIYYAIYFTIIHFLFAAEGVSLAMLLGVVFNNTIKHRLKKGYYNTHANSWDIYKIVGLGVVMVLLFILLMGHSYLYNRFELVSYWTKIVLMEIGVVAIPFGVITLCYK
jgi:hypothetical protein